MPKMICPDCGADLTTYKGVSACPNCDTLENAVEETAPGPITKPSPKQELTDDSEGLG